MACLLRVFMATARAFIQDQCLSYAAAIAYWALFSVIPLLLLVMAVFGTFMHGAADREAAVRALSNILGNAVSRAAIRSEIDALVRSAGRIGAVGVVLALISATSVFNAIREGISAVWGQPSKQPFLRGKLIDLLMVLLVGSLVLLSFTATTALSAISALSTQLFGGQAGTLTGTVLGLAYFVVPPAISFLAFGLIFWVVPRATLSPADVWAGALVSAVLFQCAQIGFGIYVAHFANYARLYGSLGAVIALLTFMYVSAVILLLGTEVTKATVTEARAESRISLTPSQGTA